MDIVDRNYELIRGEGGVRIGDKVIISDAACYFLATVKLVDGKMVAESSDKVYDVKMESAGEWKAVEQ